MQKRLNLCKTIVEIVKNSVGVVSRVKLFLLALFFLFHTTTFAYFPICCGCFLAFLVVAYPDISFFAFFGVHSCLPHTLCFIFFLFFSGCVPRYFIFRFFRGTFLSFSYIMFHIFLAFWWSRTPTFHFSPFSGYISVFLIHYVSYFPCFLVVAYPDISFLNFFGVRAFSYITYYGFSTLLFTENVPRYFIFYISLGTHLLVHHLLWLQHTPIHRKRTPTFYFLHFSGYATQLLNLFPSPTMHKRIPCGTSLHTVSFN